MKLLCGLYMKKSTSWKEVDEIFIKTILFFNLPYRDELV